MVAAFIVIRVKSTFGVVGEKKLSFTFINWTTSKKFSTVTKEDDTGTDLLPLFTEMVHVVQRLWKELLNFLFGFSLPVGTQPLRSLHFKDSQHHSADAALCLTAV